MKKQRISTESEPKRKKMTEEEKKARRAERRKARREAAKTKEPDIEIAPTVQEHKVTVITEKPKPAKKAKPKIYPNGEYIPEPTNPTKLKQYVTTYFRAVGWKNRTGDYQFPDSNVHIKNFKLDKLKEEKAVKISFDAVIVTDNAMLSKKIEKTYTLANHKEVRTDIIHIYREVKNTKLVQRNKVKKKELIKRNWTAVY